MTYVYGTVPGFYDTIESSGDPAFFAVDSTGAIIGVVRDVPRVWDMSNFGSAAPGDYALSAWLLVETQTKAGCSLPMGCWNIDCTGADLRRKKEEKEVRPTDFGGVRDAPAASRLPNRKMRQQNL